MIGTLTAGELGRKLLHMAVGLPAFALRFLGPAGAAVVAVVAILHNLFILPRIARGLWRDEERARGQSIGMVLYPVTVLILILIYWQRLEVAAAAWGILAFGDGMAAVVGRAFGRVKLPWNRDKSWAGTLGYLVFGTAAAATLLVWTAPVSGHAYDWSFAVAICAVATLLAALAESLPQGLDDNFGVPLLSSLVIFGLVLTQGGWETFLTPERITLIGIGLGVSLALGVLAYFLRTVDGSGIVGGTLVGTVIYGCLGWPGFAVLLAFFVIGSALTKLGYRRKAAAGLAQEKGGRRGARHAFANAGVAAFCALFAAATPYPELFALAFAGAFATAAADTAGSEVGQLYGRRTFLITTLRPVPRGTDGAVSLEGTLAGIAASLVIGGLGYALGLFGGLGVALVAVAAFVGTTLESVFGATLEKRGLLDNEAVNFLNTLVGALAAAGLYALFPG